MIKIGSDFGCFYLPKISLAHIFCLLSAFDGSCLKEDIWLQEKNEKISAAIARNGGRLYLYSDGDNTDELCDFIKVIGYNEVFCEKVVAERMKLKTIKEFNVLLKHSTKTLEFSPFDISVKSIYEGLSKGCDQDIELPPFSTFAPDLSHRLRHGGAVAVLKEYGAAVAFMGSFGGIINGISVDKAFRNKGFGSQLLEEVCCLIDGDVFVCADNENTEFYIKNGFTIIDKAVIAR